MRKKIIYSFCCLFLLIFPLSVFSYDLFYNNPAFSLPKEKNRKILNLVFVEIGPVSDSQFSKATALLIKKIKITMPFKDLLEAVSVWQVTLSEKETRDFFKRHNDFPYLSVRQDFLDSIKGHIKKPFKLIILDSQGSVVCAENSSIKKTSVIILSKKQYLADEIFSRSFLHELGHALGLRDENEYGYSCAAGQPNCAATKEDAVAWWGDLAKEFKEVSYFSGCCGKHKYIRPTAKSVMNDIQKSDIYGQVNERYLREVFKNSAE